MSIEAEVRSSSPKELRCYLVGASRDGTRSRLHRTLRISQKGIEWLDVLAVALSCLGSRSWRYQEGTRGVWTLETTWWDPLQATTPREVAAFSRGYFDAEGGVPRAPDARFYLQFVQKDLADIASLRSGLVNLGIDCGRLYNPSVRVDPHYWRFFVRTAAHRDFCSMIGSWHPRKRTVIHRFLNRADQRLSRTTSGLAELL